MTRMMETLESRQMFSVTAVEPVATSTTTTTVATADIVVTKPIDKGSTKLFQACATGTHYPDVVLTA